MNEEQKEQNIPAPAPSENNNQNIIPTEDRHRKRLFVFFVFSAFMLLQASFISSFSSVGIISTLVLAIIPSLFVFFWQKNIKSWQIVFIGIILQEFIFLISYLLVILIGFVGSFDIGKLFFNIIYIFSFFICSLFTIDNIIFLFLGIVCMFLLYYNKNVKFRLGAIILTLILWAIITYSVASKGGEHAFNDFISGGGILGIFLLLALIHNFWKSGVLLISQKIATLLGITIIILFVSLSFMAMRYILHLWYWDLGY